MSFLTCRRTMKQKRTLEMAVNLEGKLRCAFESKQKLEIEFGYWGRRGREIEIEFGTCNRGSVNRKRIQKLQQQGKLQVEIEIQIEFNDRSRMQT